MIPYSSVSEATGVPSGVVSYYQGEDYILVEFAGGATYKYSHHSCGAHHVEKMKKLAEAQHGLSTYIAQNKDALDYEWRTAVT